MSQLLSIAHDIFKVSTLIFP